MKITRIASEITLDKLRRLFDDAAQGMLDESLLDEVASEWHQYLDGLAKSLERGYDPIGTSYGSDPELLRRLKRSVMSLEQKQPTPQAKFSALNIAIQSFHHDMRLLGHYFRDKGVVFNEDEKMWFLDWLSSERRQVGDRQVTAQEQERIRQAAILQEVFGGQV